MIYLDHSATTPLAEEALNAMIPYFRTHYANASSRIYPSGRHVSRVLDMHMQALANILKVEKGELHITSGATQSCNWALRGLWKNYSKSGKKKIMLSKIEHNAVLKTALYLEKEHGAELVWIPIKKSGIIDIDFVYDNLNEEFLCIALMAANNITGVKQPIKQVGSLAKNKGVFFFCDATQIMASEEFLPNEVDADLVAASAHKFYGPKGIGLLYVRRKIPRVNLPVWEHGGGDNKIAGTENVAAIIGMVKALEWCRKQDWHSVSNLRNKMEENFKDWGAIIIGEEEQRIKNVSNIVLPKLKARTLQQNLQDYIAFSTASACSSQSTKPSYVLEAMNLPEEYLLGSFRLSWGLTNTEEELNKCVTLFEEAIKS